MEQIKKVGLPVVGSFQEKRDLIAGVAQFTLESNGQAFLFGDQDEITSYLDAVSVKIRRLVLVHTQSPKEEVLKFLADKNISAAAITSPLKTLLKNAESIIGLLPFCTHTALSGLQPTVKKKTAMLLDVGLPNQAKAQDLVSFSLLASLFSNLVIGQNAPRLALLASENGLTEEIATAEKILRLQSKINFAGTASILDIHRGIVDIVVTEGAIGSVVFELLDGLADIIEDLSSNEKAKKQLVRLGLGGLSAESTLLSRVNNKDQKAGQPILGINANMVYQRRCTKQATKLSLDLALKMADLNFIEKATELLSNKRPYVD